MTNIAAVGEAYGEEEARQCLPFVGYSGSELTRMLDEAGIHRADIFLTNVFNLHPPGNKLEHFCGPKAEAIEGYPVLAKGRYIRAEFQPEMDRLAGELIDANPNVIIALGNTAMWALLGKTAISKFRGTTDISTHTATGFKVLPTYHPAAVCRQWELRPVTVLDLMKALRESEYPEIRRPQREIWIEPSLEDIERFVEEHIKGCQILSVDIETSGNQITCIGFAPSNMLALVVPFRDLRKKSKSYWPTQKQELKAWGLIKNILEDPGIKKVLQNALFDVSVLWRSYGIGVKGVEHDDMLLHHSLQPESLKGLGFLASVYCAEASWKHMRVETLKREE